MLSVVGQPKSGQAVTSARPPRPSVFQAGHIPSWRGSCGSYALSPVAAVSRWLLPLLSPLLSPPPWSRAPSSSTPSALFSFSARVKSRFQPGIMHAVQITAIAIAVTPTAGIFASSSGTAVSTMPRATGTGRGRLRARPGSAHRASQRPAAGFALQYGSQPRGSPSAGG